MPTIEENRLRWSTYEWAQAGDEWSEVWGGTAYLWWGSIFPRIMSWLPAGTILELAPGFGRCTQYLKEFCSELVVVDLAERCIEACRERFRDQTHIRYFVNDGLSLEMVGADSVDFAFSFDSLVHVEAEVMRSYVSQLAEILSPGGVAFLHHSNVLALRDPLSGRPDFENRHWRAESVSASLVARYCREAGLHCLAQELVNWGSAEMTDCFSLLARRPGEQAEPPQVRENPAFMDEAIGLGSVSRHLGAHRPG